MHWLTRADLERFEARLLDHLDQRFAQLKELLMSEQDDINAIATDLGTVGTTLGDAIARLEAQLAAGQAPDLTQLKTVQAALDQLAAANPEPTPPPAV